MDNPPSSASDAGHNDCVQVLSTQADSLLAAVLSVRYRVDLTEGSWYELPSPRLTLRSFTLSFPILRF